MMPGMAVRTFKRFNEAAGIPRGRRPGRHRRRNPWPGFNEAAGIPRGRRANAANGYEPGARLQ